MCSEMILLGLCGLGKRFFALGWWFFLGFLGGICGLELFGGI